MHADDWIIQADAGREKFEAFFRREFPQVTALVIKAGFPREDAADAAEEAMVGAYERWEYLETPSRWVRKVAIRHVLRTNHRRREEIQRGVQGGWVRMPQDDGDRTAVVDSRMRLLPLLAALPPRRQFVMALHLDGWGASEIADLFGITSESVRSHLRHARQSLQKAIAALDRPGDEVEQ